MALCMTQSIVTKDGYSFFLQGKKKNLNEKAASKKPPGGKKK
jgi:hypothetical protein